MGVPLRRGREKDSMFETKESNTYQTWNERRTSKFMKRKDSQIS